MAMLLSFPANDIRVEGMAVDAELPASWLRERLADSEVNPPDNNGRIRGRLSRSGVSDIVVRTRVVATLTVPCARCLEPAAIQVNADLSLLLVPVARADARRRNGGGEDYVFSASEAHHDTYDGETVVLDDFVRELLLLEVPSFPLCRDECPGIHALDDGPPPPFADPRLAPLSAFRDEPEAPVTVDDLVAAARERSERLGGGGKRVVLRSSHAGHKTRRKK